MVATILRVLRLRHVLSQASRRRSLALLVLVCAVLLLSLLAFHSAEHGIEDGAVLTCAAIVLVAAVGMRSAPRPPRVRTHFFPPRSIPIGAFAVAVPQATESPPGFFPLRR